MQLPDGVTRALFTSIAKAKKNSPHIFFGAGLASSIASTVMACRATLKLEDVLDEIQEGKAILDADMTLTDEENTRLYRWHVARGLVKIAKLYGPTVGLEVIAVVALSGSHVQMTKRNSALVATLVAAHQGVEKYREKVEEVIGDEKEMETYVDANLSLVDKRDWNAMTRIFDEGSSNYHKDSEINREFLHWVQKKANLRLRTHGVVYLNDVYEMLGFEKTRIGKHYGWVYGADGIKEIDFGIFESSNSRFINGLERAVVLNFNVDGVVSDYI